MRIHIESSTSYRGRNSRPNWAILALFIGSTLAVAGVGAFFSPGLSASSTAWYAELAKPTWVPPNQWFGAVWTVLYVLMACAAWLVWAERYHERRNAALGAYVLQLLINAAWAPLFFGARSVGGGLFLSIALWLALAWTVRNFAAVKPVAAWLLFPYLLWASYASALSYSIWKMNP